MPRSGLLSGKAAKAGYYSRSLVVLRARSGQNIPLLGIFIPSMSTQLSDPMAHSALADALFSRTRQRVLGLLFGQPTRSFYASELIAMLASGSGAVQRELASLTQSGLVTVRAVGNQKHYQANPDSPIYSELCGIAQKTVGLVGPLREALAPIASRIIAAFVYGSVAKNSDTASSDVDLMLLSDDVSYSDVFAALEIAGTSLGRTVNPTILMRKEFVKRRTAGQSFLTRVLEQPKIWIIGTEHDLTI